MLISRFGRVFLLLLVPFSGKSSEAWTTNSHRTRSHRWWRQSLLRASPSSDGSFRAVSSLFATQRHSEMEKRRNKKGPRSQQPPSLTGRMREAAARGLVSLLLVLQTLFFSLPTAATAVSSAVTVDDDPYAGGGEAVHKNCCRRYYSTMATGCREDRVATNTALLDFAVGTISSMYYDKTAGAAFAPRDFHDAWRTWQKERAEAQLSTRRGAVSGLRWLVEQLQDPYSKYLTREELRAEFGPASDGFLGLGCLVEAPGKQFFGAALAAVVANPPPPSLQQKGVQGTGKTLLTAAKIQHLPVVAAVTPDSPAERAGLTVGDRIVAVGSDSFLDLSKTAVQQKLQQKYSAENYMGHPELVVAKAVYAVSPAPTATAASMMNVAMDGTAVIEDNVPSFTDRDVIRGYRQTRVRLPTVSAEPFLLTDGVHGNSFVHYQMLTEQDSIFDKDARQRTGYIRLTRFSRASTAGFLQAVEDLEKAGATSFIIDLRNNYGGIIQEAMLTASTLLRDPHAVLCYTMNSRGSFTPHDVEEFVVDTRYPGYLLSKEPRSATLHQVRREHPELFPGNQISTNLWSPPSGYASLREQSVKRGIHKPALTFVSDDVRQQLAAQKNIVLLINEGTASSAEVFASALHDNGRTVALVGAKTYGKGLIQHTFPMPDGGGLRLTVAEYLTPALHHVTHVGGAEYDRMTGEWIGGGIRPDIACDSKQGIPGNVGADLCVGVALDALKEAETARDYNRATVKRTGGMEDGSRIRRPISVGIVRDDF